MSQKFPANNFKWIKDTSQFNEDFTKSYNGESDERYFLEVDAQYPEKLHDLYNDLLFLPERVKIEKVEKCVANLHYKNEYIIHIRNLKQALNHRLVLKKFHRIIKFRQGLVKIIYWYEHRSKKINKFENDFSKFMNNAVFGKTIENVRKQRY